MFRPVGTGKLTIFLAAILILPGSWQTSIGFSNERPNILWLSTEDIGPEIGCYGDSNAVTPNLDAFAKRGLVYDVAWSNYPVCAPARTTIIAGMYACANGAGNMRSSARLPDGVEMFPFYLREAGYYCTNNSKEDYNYQAPENRPWDESSRKAHWRNRAEGQPFFAVFNHTGTHESKIRSRPHQAVIDPATLQIRPYWPDVPAVRQDFAQYYDNITTMDSWFQKQLDEVTAAGLAEDTIVIFWGDHGSGMPRHKRFAGNSGQHVPLIVHVPQKWKHLAPAEYIPGGHSKRPVGFVDFAPTTLSTVGIRPPDHMQGHAFMGEFKTEDPRYVYGFRDRMDERPDTSRALRDQRFIYVRNYMPHVPAGQHVEYQFQTPTTAVWKAMFDAGELNDVQAHFWKPHPTEEFYDLENDPFETQNLIDDPKMQDHVARFRDEHKASMLRFGDLGLIPEPILFEFGSDQPRRQILQEEGIALNEVLHVADHAANFDVESVPKLVSALESPSAVNRYWGAIGLLVRGEDIATKHLGRIEQLASDESSIVAIVAGELLVRFGTPQQQSLGKSLLLEKADPAGESTNFYSAIHALNAIDRLDERTEFDKSVIEKLPQNVKKPPRGGNYIQQLVNRICGKKKKNDRN